MDRNAKFLKKLNRKEFAILATTLQQLQDNQTKSLNIKKLSGHKDVYRLRVQQLRIIFITNRDKIEILEISRRNENTCKNY